MTLNEHLETLCRTHASCHVAAFGDLRSKLVYRAVGSGSLRREVLDQVTEAAARLFDTSDHLPGMSREPVGHVLMLAPTETRVVVRSGEDGSDFVCCLCAPDTDPGPIIDAAKDVLLAQSGRA